jgi:formamidopyrimidine-DNA glycosylase
MPELAEVEYYRRCWNAGLGQKITRVHANSGKRVFDGLPMAELRRRLLHSVFISSEASGKQLLFCFSADLWLGVHLGMTGQLQIGPPDLIPGRHDHFVLYQRERSLVFTDPRLFGRIRFAHGQTAPEWWAKLPMPVSSPRFTRERMEGFLRRHPRLPIKAALLDQAGFPGIGNWMADEILWRAKVHPLLPCRRLSMAQIGALWRCLRLVCRGAMKYVSHDFSDPPAGWLFNERWGRGGTCPIHKILLQKQAIGGRTSAWCPRCQP